jgi:hypothetical protein
MAEVDRRDKVHELIGDLVMAEIEKMNANTFIGNWSDDEKRMFFNSGWILFKGRHIWTAWKEKWGKKRLIVCKKIKSLSYWVTLGSKSAVSCCMCKNSQIGGCVYCRKDRTNYHNLSQGLVKNYDEELK